MLRTIPFLLTNDCFSRLIRQTFGGIEKFPIYPIVQSIKQEVIEDAALPVDTMQKVPSLSDLSDQDSSLGKSILTKFYADEVSDVD